MPWYDPAFDPRTPLGRKMVTRSLEAQIAPVHCAIVLASVYETKSAHSWVELEIEIARKHGKTLFGVASQEGGEASEKICEITDVILPWDAAEAIKLIIEKIG